MLNLRNLDQLLKKNLKGKIVYIRVDLNVPFKDDIILDATRIERIIPTVNELTKKGSKVCLLSHLGRPNGENNDKLTLKKIVPTLEKYLKKDILFIDDFYEEKNKRKIELSSSEQVILLSLIHI